MDPWTLHREAYGRATPALQGVVDRARRIGNRLSDAQEGVLPALASRHLGSLMAAGVPVIPIADTLILRDLRLLRTAWGNGAAWREAVAECSGRLFSLPRSQEERERLRGPLWPVGIANVFGVTMVATPNRLAQCPPGTDPNLYWEVLCFIESLVDSELVATLFHEALFVDVFAPLTQACEFGYLPLGWHNGRFVFLSLAEAVIGQERGDETK